MADAEGEEQPVEIADLSGFDVRKDLVCKHRSHPLDRDQLFLRQVIDIGWVLDEASIEKNRDPALAQSLDVHHAGEVSDPAKHLGGTGDVGAVAHSLARRPHGLATADGAGLRDAVRLLLAASLLEDGADYLRYDVPGALDYDRVALANILPPDVVFVVKRRLLYDHPADLHRLENREWVEAPGAPDVHGYTL